MKVIEVESYQEMSQVAGKYMIEKLQEVKFPVLGLATGSTPVGLYDYLIEEYKKGAISFKSTTTFNLDEYINVPAENSNSYHYFMQEKLFDHIDIPTDQVHIPNGTATNLEQECEKYDQTIQQAGGIDVQVLGIGANGHIGFNEPPTPFDSKTHIVDLDESTREANARFFKTVEEVPSKAITCGIDTIMKSKQILLLISGKAKQKAFHTLMNGDITEQFPASVLKKHPNCIVIVDKEAAGK